MRKREFFKAKKIILAMSLDKNRSLYQNWYKPLKNLCKKLILFDTRKNLLIQGQESMNKHLLELVEKEKPDYIFFYWTYDEVYLDTLIKIKESSETTKTVNFFSDDDTQFESFSRYHALFFDYNLMSQPNLVKNYKREGIKNVFLIYPLVNIEDFKPLNLKKIYDVTFIGAPKAQRYAFIKFLMNKGINIRLYGWGWDKYPEFKDIYHGPLDNSQLIKVINQSKIVLSFSENAYGQTHYKGRVYKIVACKSFVLEQYFSGHRNFFNKGELVMFKSKRDLLNKINYYLENDKEREKITERAYKKIVKKYNINIQLRRFINKTLNKSVYHKELPKLNKKIITLNERDFELSIKRIKEKVEDADYISFSKDECNAHFLRDYLQAYSLQRTKKKISCCSYYVYSKLVGNYMYFFIDDAYRKLSSKNFASCLNINQLMVDKHYFIKNYTAFKKVFEGDEISFINEKNSVFVDIPLIQIKDVKIKDYKVMKEVFRFKFLYEINYFY